MENLEAPDLTFFGAFHRNRRKLQSQRHGGDQPAALGWPVAHFAVTLDKSLGDGNAIEICSSHYNISKFQTCLNVRCACIVVHSLLILAPRFGAFHRKRTIKVLDFV